MDIGTDDHPPLTSLSERQSDIMCLLIEEHTIALQRMLDPKQTLDPIKSLTPIDSK